MTMEEFKEKYPERIKLYKIYNRETGQEVCGPGIEIDPTEVGGMMFTLYNVEYMVNLHSTEYYAVYQGKKWDQEVKDYQDLCILSYQNAFEKEWGK
jgi:hypothetical protein